MGIYEREQFAPPLEASFQNDGANLKVSRPATETDQPRPFPTYGRTPAPPAAGEERERKKGARLRSLFVPQAGIEPARL